MSRAFTKEIDDQTPPPLPQRPVSSARNLVTPAGARMIDDMIASLQSELSEAQNDEETARLRRDLRYWEVRHATMEIIDYPDVPDAIRFGTIVTVLRGGKMQDLAIVGEDEADAGQGKIAWTSPLAKAIDGTTAAEEIEFELPGRTETIKILTIRSAGGAAEETFREETDMAGLSTIEHLTLNGVMQGPAALDEDTRDEFQSGGW
jgi:transcription elongation factor GreB